jgi:hypothetical protein
MKKKGRRQGEAFGLQHCWKLLNHDEKWKKRLFKEILKKISVCLARLESI